MALREIPAAFPASTVHSIDACLAGICRDEGVAIPWAIESGSRAWGFPSPDSDFDCRFVYVRPVDQHLSPWQRRDVIEAPLVGELDINGWDLAKALKLLIKGNAVIVEWLRSPIIYSGQAWFRDALLGFAARHSDRDNIARHYLYSGEQHRQKDLADPAHVRQKKLFYALRPAAALRWLRRHPDQVIVPMDLPTLMSECEPPREVAALVAELIERKSATRELGYAPLPEILAAFMNTEFELARSSFAKYAPSPPDARRDEAEAFYRELVRQTFAAG